MNYICPKCLGDGFTSWVSIPARNSKKSRKRIDGRTNIAYKDLCLVCLGVGGVDWIQNVSQTEIKITDAFTVITDALSKRLGDYCVRAHNYSRPTHYINEEFAEFDNRQVKKKWSHVILSQ